MQYRPNSLMSSSCICCGHRVPSPTHLILHMRDNHTETEIKEAIKERQKEAIQKIALV